MMMNAHYSDAIGESLTQMIRHNRNHDEGDGVDWYRASAPLSEHALVWRIILRQMVRSKARFISVFGSTMFSCAFAMFALSLTGASARFELSLIIAAVSCLIVGVVSISQSLQVAATQSRSENQMLLAIGFNESSVRRIVLTESVLASLPGAIVGVVIGWFLALAMVPFILSQDISGFITLEASFRPWAAALVLFGGTLIALMASRRPVKMAVAADWSSVDSLSPVGDGNDMTSSKKVAWGLGVLSFLAGITLMVWSNLSRTEPSWTVVLIECLLFVIGLYVSYPLLFGLLTKGIRWVSERVFRFHRTSVLVALRSLSMRRSSSSAVSASVTVGLIFLATVTMIGSWESSHDQYEMAGTYQGTSQVRLRKSTGLKDFRQQDMDAWASMKGVEDVISFSAHEATVSNRNGRPVKIGYYSIDGNPFNNLIHTGDSSGNAVGHDADADAMPGSKSTDDGSSQSLSGLWSSGKGAIIGCELANATGMRVGDVYNIGKKGQTVPIKVIGETCDVWMNDSMLIPASLLPKDAHDITSVYIVHSPDSMVDSTEFCESMGEKYPRYVFFDRAHMIKRAGASALWELLVYYGAGALVITVAVAGLFTMMALAVMQRKREFGLLSAYGMDPGGIRASIWLEAGVIGLIAGVLGTGIGSVIGMVIGAKMGMASIDPSVWLLEAWLVVATVIVGVFAAFIPSFVAVRAGAKTIHDE